MVTPPLEHTYADTLPELVARCDPEEFPHPELVVLNDPLAESLGLDTDWLRSAEGMDFLCARGLETVALGYAGHQFGQYSPRLGDGRALLYGELVHEGRRFDLHAKGTGRTPFSRPGSDGRGTLTSMLRELLYSESLAALGVPTTRTLAVLTTGRTVVRENGPEPAAFLIRVAEGLDRVGTFQYARSGSPEVARRLADYDIHRHYPAAREAENPYLAFYRSVLKRSVKTVAQWMRLGFIHGVMNTDNTAISGQTLDFGPCAFTPRWEADAVYSSVDTQGRYRFGNQPIVLKWNLARFGETLVDLVGVEELTAALNTFDEYYREAADEQARLLLGDEASREDIEDYEKRRAQAEDLTLFHRELAGEKTGEKAPLFIPRNHLVADVLERARGGDLTGFEALLNAVSNPYDDGAGDRALASPAPEGFGPFITYCGT
ncbi:hypothetical protein C3B44_04420 [Corynebacterium yudongzhengii]|uniref:Protein nucleotidyltransferase YdiU n=1 Tax=Corynebacterium yudongzhengii TaxID=2080740 RepID=A0A2U1T663_9CORY|nr:protein adenylyltransferase SelO family protein [Corynebacterium yudongzhengii]AWB81703.1 hypothetical protein C3B44_04420 [Corynebacterium yudongzhengii]PWC01494.1 hypothetical protein DF222_06755 [Corynebacterium yudongzhengii]